MALLACAFLSVLAAAQPHGDPDGGQLIPLTRHEIRRLFTGLGQQPPAPATQLHWSRWRRRHQATAKACHYRRRGALAPTRLRSVAGVLTRVSLAMVLQAKGQMEEAEAEHRAILGICDGDLRTAIPAARPADNDMTTLLSWLGRLAEAAAEHRAVADISARGRGIEDPGALASSNNIHSVIRGLGPPTEAGARHGIFRVK